MNTAGPLVGAMVQSGDYRRGSSKRNAQGENMMQQDLNDHSRHSTADGTVTADRLPPSPSVEVLSAIEKTLTPRAQEVVGARQDDLMAVASVDGRPPEHARSMASWRVLAVLVPLITVVAVIWAMTRGVSVGAVVGFGLVFVTAVVLGGWPVLAAGLRRGKEESAARAQALTERVVVTQPPAPAPDG